VLFVADDEQKFVQTVTQLQDALPVARYTSTFLETPANEFTAQPDDMANRILAEFAQGKLLISYIGHGDYNAWGRWDAGGLSETPYIFHVDHLQRLRNRDQLPIVVMGNCLKGFFAGPTPRPAFGEELLRLPEAGAAAVLAPTGLGYPTGHRSLLTHFSQALLGTDTVVPSAVDHELGRVATAAYVKTVAENSFWQELVWTYVLLGDPALRANVVVDHHLPLIVAREP
jgi:hypothetical protein